MIPELSLRGGILFHPLIRNIGGVIAADPVNKSA